MNVIKAALVLGGSNENRLHELMWNIRRRRSPPTESFIVYDESSSPGGDDYIINADRSTLSFDPVVRLRGSRQLTRLKPTFKISRTHRDIRAEHA